MAETTVMGCNCKNEFQDKKYGKGKRIHNVRSTGGGRCTVCGNVNGGSNPGKAKK